MTIAAVCRYAAIGAGGDRHASPVSLANNGPVALDHASYPMRFVVPSNAVRPVGDSVGRQRRLVQSYDPLIVIARCERA